MPPLDSKQSKQAFIHELTALYEGKTTFIGEIMIKNYEGDNLYIQIQLAIAPGHEHNWSKVFVSMVDTTQSKKAEYDKEKLILTLGEKNTELEHYTYTVSHDLKSPLVTLAGFVGLLKKDLKEGKPDRVNKDLNRISEAVSTMEQLLNDLLKLSRVNRLQTPVEYIKPNIAIGEVINMLSINMVDANAKIDIQSPMPTIRMDSTSFKEIFLNLINNALKYRKLDLPVHIKIGTRQEQQQTIFFVQDNGIGIEPGYFKKIFGLFERLDNEYEGTGIGLAIVKRIIDIYKGHIWVESDGLNQGATFCFTLPTQNTGKFND